MPGMFRYVKTPWSMAALYDTSATPRCFAPCSVPCLYEVARQTSLNPPPPASVVPKRSGKVPVGPSFQPISPRYVPEAGGAEATQPRAAEGRGGGRGGARGAG